MRNVLALVILAVAAAPASLAQQGLVCPPLPSSMSGKSCEAFHYHVQLHRPDAKGFTEVTAIAPFATQPACDRAREERVRRNLAVVDYFKRIKGQQQYEPDRVGPCHCDMTSEKTSPVYLQETQRQAQSRTAEDTRLRVREKLLDSGLTSDSELVRGLLVLPPSLPLLGAPKLVAMPDTPPSTAVPSPDELESTGAVETAKPIVISLDMPLVEVVTETVAPASDAADPGVAVADATGAPPPAATAEIAVEPAAPAEEAAESFISYETQRIQNVLRAASAISEESVKSKIFEAVQHRIQLLSNLRSLIEGSGVRSRLAAAARAAQSESERVALATRLFGESITRAWAPKDAAEVVIESVPEVDTEPERVLRDTAGRFTDEQKRRALYMLLARTQPTNDQQLWLITIADSFVR